VWGEGCEVSLTSWTTGRTSQSKGLFAMSDKTGAAAASGFTHKIRRHPAVAIVIATVLEGSMALGGIFAASPAQAVSTGYGPGDNYFTSSNLLINSAIIAHLLNFVLCLPEAHKKNSIACAFPDIIGSASITLHGTDLLPSVRMFVAIGSVLLEVSAVAVCYANNQSKISSAHRILVILIACLGILSALP